MFGYWIIIIVFCMIPVVGSCAWFYKAYYDDSRFQMILSIIVGAVIVLLIIFSGLWYMNGTESGKRMKKSWESETKGGIERVVTVYDINGGILCKYEGKFDVDYDESRIIFDDENGKRHVIYYTTGTVIIDDK